MDLIASTDALDNMDQLVKLVESRLLSGKSKGGRTQNKDN